MIAKEQAKANEIMGADVKQSGRAVRQLGQVSALAGQGGQPEVLRRRAQAFSKEAADLLLEIGIIKAIPDIAGIIDTSFIK